MFRFFVKEKTDEYFIISQENFNHMKSTRVLQKEFICIYQQKFYICKLKTDVQSNLPLKDDNNNFNAYIIKEIIENHEKKGEVIIAAAIIKTKRFELLIEKAAELGATKLIPILSKNVEQNLGNNITKKLLRWNTIAKMACQQSFRNKIMIVEFPVQFINILESNLEHKYIAHEKTIDHENISFPVNSIFLVGPEGGFTDIEINLAIKNNWRVINLGARILRAETASIKILSKVL